MKKISLHYKIQVWLLRFVYVQLFITLISLPILVWWGMPISFLTILGNLIFSPFLSLFLFLSSLLFFSELLGIPNSLLVILLEYLTQVWFMCISIADKQWLVSLPKPPTWWCIVVPLITIMTVIQVVQRSWLVKISGLLLIFTLSCGYLKFIHAPGYLCISIPSSRGALKLVHIDKKTLLIDQGALNGTPSPETWVEYTLLQELTKSLGSCHVHHYIITQPTIRALKAAETLVRLAHVDHVHVPYWKGDADRNLLRAYGELKATMVKERVVLHRIGNKKITVPIAAQVSLHILSEHPIIQKKTITFYTISCELYHHKEKIPIS